jgi:hypothetical protein
MKKKNAKKLSLTRITISNLEKERQMIVKGGYDVVTIVVTVTTIIPPTWPQCHSNAIVGKLSWCFECGASYVQRCMPTQQCPTYINGSCQPCGGGTIIGEEFDALR